MKWTERQTWNRIWACQPEQERRSQSTRTGWAPGCLGSWPESWKREKGIKYHPIKSVRNKNTHTRLRSSISALITTQQMTNTDESLMTLKGSASCLTPQTRSSRKCWFVLWWQEKNRKLTWWCCLRAADPPGSDTPTACSDWWCSPELRSGWWNWTSPYERSAEGWTEKTKQGQCLKAFFFFLLLKSQPSTAL